ncbi:kinesin-like protein KIN-10C isoform X2 [Cinnamomum micranthum f. kanehirae]|uniref:Kinesin-like protein KIN-10C isoform X2 n=1 Tax=Cinnamomum micranthum f. kanehirae TaxID=337451 RepID=A0A443PLT7_9MAGN|nr:kinesin-like protein KIN-10C isoform X2 [Cinnamomum micranthum f. kanehirae]
MASSKINSAHGNSHKLSDLHKKVRIVGKIRGLLESEAKSTDGSSSPWISVQKSSDCVTILCKDQTSSSSKDYKLDYCYEQHQDIPEIFSREVKPLVSRIFDGFNASVIAYGARGSGKTHTIQGSCEKPGLAALAMAEILSSCEETGRVVKISCYEVYHDHVYDLLERKEQEVLVWEDRGRIQLKGLSQVHVKSISEFNRLYFNEYDQYKPSQKIVNEIVRRSHKGLIIYVFSRDKDSNISVVGKLNFVDLAGYEDTKRMSIDIPQLLEIPRINKSLYAVENVVRALNANERHVPFRDTKLTRMLQDSIGGASQALMITCLNPTFCQDSIHVISWASRSFQAANLTCQDSAKKAKSSAMIMGLSSPPASRAQSLSASMKNLGGSLYYSGGKKTTNMPHGMKERNVLPVVRPTLKSSQESTTLSTAKSMEVLTLDEERCLQSVTNTKEPFTPKQDLCTQDDVEFNRKPMTDLEGREVENSPADLERSPPISAKLREIANALKAFSTPIPLSIKTPNPDNIRNNHVCKDLIESLTPGVPVDLRVDEWESAKAGTPGETFKTHSCGLKKSLVQEYLKFLNSASKEELKEIKGIGEKRANYILEFREESPEPFKNLEDLKEIGLSSKQINGIMRQIAGQLFS